MKINLNYRSIIFLSVFIVACGDGNVKQPTSEVVFNLPELSGVSFDNPNTVAVFTVDGKPCLLSKQEQIVDCKTLSFGEHQYELLYTEKSNNRILAKATSSFTVIEGESVSVKPVLDYEFDADNNGENDVNDFVASFSGNWKTMHWGRGNWN